MDEALYERPAAMLMLMLYQEVLAGDAKGTTLTLEDREAMDIVNSRMKGREDG